jgi:ankyrin repeat protein
MENLESSERKEKLLAALQHDEYDIFSENLGLSNPNPWYNEPYRSSLLEIACQMKDGKQFVELLLERGADPNIPNRVTDMPLLHATVQRGNFEVLEVLLKENETDVCVTDSEHRTILHWWARVSETERDDKQVLENCFKLIMEKYSANKMDIDCPDISDNTALYTAVESGFRDRAKLLLSAGVDITVFEHGSKILVEAVSSTVEEILDYCLDSNDKPETIRDLKVTLNYEVLMKIFPRMAESKRVRNLLRNPVMSTFLILKRQNVRFIFILDTVFYIMFLILLTTYILYSESYITPNYGGVASNTTGPSSSNGSYIMSGINDKNSVSQTNSSSFFSCGLF